MPFNVALTAVLSGASQRQLGHWRRTSLLVPEVSASRRILYSFRDVLALRTVVKLREDQSLQRIRRAFRELPNLDLTDHPSRYSLVSTGASIVVVETGGVGVDLVEQPGHVVIARLDDVMAPFESRHGEVVDLRHPRPHLSVREQRLGGWPTIAGTRVPFDAVATLLSDETVDARDVGDFYPGVSPEAAHEALDFARSLPDWRDSTAA